MPTRQQSKLLRFYLLFNLLIKNMMQKIIMINSFTSTTLDFMNIEATEHPSEDHTESFDRNNSIRFYIAINIRILNK